MTAQARKPALTDEECIGVAEVAVARLERGARPGRIIPTLDGEEHVTRAYRYLRNLLMALPPKEIDDGRPS